jgi:hypothetical protein
MKTGSNFFQHSILKTIIRTYRSKSRSKSARKRRNSSVVSSPHYHATSPKRQRKSLQNKKSNSRNRSRSPKKRELVKQRPPKSTNRSKSPKLPLKDSADSPIVLDDSPMRGREKNGPTLKDRLGLKSNIAGHSPNPDGNFFYK